ncbi:MAG: gamma carbonic anhydrase family protein [bacterium]
MSDLPFLLQKQPLIHPSVFIAQGVKIIGDVRIGKDASIWFNSVLRGDISYISIGERTNIQDGSIIHVDNNSPCIIGKEVTVGHQVNLHGCIVEDWCLIGIGAIILTGAKIKKGSLIAAGSLVKEGTTVEERSLMAGVPAKKVRALGPEFFDKRRAHALKYFRLAETYKNKLVNL